MKHYIENKVIVITGGSSGFGLEAARELLEMGAKVTITGRNQQRLDKAAEELKHENLLVVQADAVKTEDWKKLSDQVMSRFGRIDVLVNNHGAGCVIAPVETLSDEDIQLTLDVNIASVVKGCREVIPLMRANKKGHIINVASACSRYSWPNWSVYTAAKAGLVGFTKCVHLEMAEWGGKATTFIPGAARTGFCNAANIEDEWMEGYPTADEFVRTMIHCIDVPDDCVIQDVAIWGTKQISDMMNPF